ncbi:MAG: DNA polymerase IV [Oligoflexia bacterium]|nr:DNA polymerase IV [Oligoflexia bacterium]
MSGAGRKIIHVDMDAFFASVEQRDRPELRGKPVVVGGSPEKRGVVAAASYEARRFGVRSAMSAAKARRLCPQAVFLPPDFRKYSEVSRQIREIFLSVTPLVEPLSLDEAYLDVTENLLNEPLARKVAEYVKREIRTKTGLSASAGVAPNKFVAKVASDFRKPDGLVVVPPEKVLAFVEKLPVGKLWGVGPVTEKKLQSMGIWTAAEIRKRPVAELEQVLGSFGAFLYRLAFGEDDRPVESERESKSCGAERTFERDLVELTELVEILRSLVSEVADWLKDSGRPGRTVTLKLRYSDFKTITRSKTMPVATDDPARILEVAERLLREGTEAGHRPARLIGVSVSGLRGEEEPEQLWLQFPPPWDRF